MGHMGAHERQRPLVPNLPDRRRAMAAEAAGAGIREQSHGGAGEGTADDRTRHEHDGIPRHHYDRDRHAPPPPGNQHKTQHQPPLRSQQSPCLTAHHHHLPPQNPQANPSHPLQHRTNSHPPPRSRYPRLAKRSRRHGAGGTFGGSMETAVMGGRCRNRKREPDTVVL